MISAAEETERFIKTNIVQAEIDTKAGAYSKQRFVFQLNFPILI